ncbi:MAG: hypothetical protein H7124_03860 [Phycisphaerales bacterium]|nr:hypothetical protein [Hyphomonadaceae bacterium]
MLRKGFIAAALLLSSCATQPTEGSASSDRECFRAGDVNGYSVIDSHTVRVTVGPSRHYLLGTTWNANDLDWSTTIAIRSSAGRICTGNGLGVDIIGGDPRRTYPITSIVRAPEEPVTEGS